MARHVHHDAAVKRLSVGAGSAAAGAKGQRAETLFSRQACNQRHVCGGAGKHYRVGQQLIDTVVGRHRQPVGVAGGDIAIESVLL
ncbi:hypothetical protein D3C71_1762520 [compost metagenome]